MRRQLIKINFLQFDQRCTLDDEELMSLTDEEIFSISQREFWNIIERIKERNVPPIEEEAESIKVPTETTESRQEAQ